jgi:hypothetical protein
MDPNFKLILEEILCSKEEMRTCFDEQDAKWERRFSDLDSARKARDSVLDQRLGALESGVTVVDPAFEQRLADLESLRLAQIRFERDERMSKLEAAVPEFTSWRQDKGVIDNLRLKVKKLDSHWDRAVFDTMPQHQPGILSSPSSASARAPAGHNADGPMGHGSPLITRDSSQGSAATLVHVPAIGKPPDLP